MIGRRVAAGIAAFVAGVPLLHFWRGLEWPFAAIVGLALGAFAFLLVRAVQNLRAWSPRR